MQDGLMPRSNEFLSDRHGPEIALPTQELQIDAPHIVEPHCQCGEDDCGNAPVRPRALPEENPRRLLP